MTENHLIRKGLGKALSILLTLTMVFGSMGFMLTDAYGLEKTTAENSLEKVVDFYSTNQEGILYDYWELLAIYGAVGNPLDYVIPQKTTINDSSNPTDYAGAFIADLVRGILPLKSAAEKLVSKQDPSNGGFGYEMSNQQAWAIIALDMYNRNAPLEEQVEYDVKKAIEYLMTFQDNGNFFFSLQYNSPGVDYTGAAAIALAPYINTEIWPETLELNELIKALKYDKEQYGSYGNGSTAAFAIFGYNALGVSVDNEDYQNALDELISYQVTSGGFYSPWGDINEADQFTTKQAAIALVETVFGKSLFLNLVKNEHILYPIKVKIQENDSIISKYITITNEMDVSTIVKNSVAGDTDLSQYNYYIGKEKVGDSSFISEGQQLVAVPKTVTHLTSFSLDKEEVTIGDTVNLNISIESLVGYDNVSFAPGARLMLNETELLTFEENQKLTYSFQPVEAGAYEFYIDWPENIKEYSMASCSIAVAKLSQAIPVSIRVEGIDRNILYNDKFLAKGSEKLLTVFDVITQALTHSGISFETDGASIISIDNIANDMTFNTSKHWMYTINEKKYLDGSEWVLPTTLIKDNDEIVVYCGSSATYPFIKSELKDNGDIELSLTSYQFDENWVPVLKPIQDATIAWAAGTEKAHSDRTNSSGKVTIPSSKANEGSYAVQIEKIGDDGIPLVIRMSPNFEINVSREGAEGSNPSNPSDNVPKVSVQVIGPDKGTIFPKNFYTYSEGITALDLLRRTGLNIGYGNNSKTYVSSIEGYKEFDYGPTSGWLFKVNNDESILSSAAAYVLESGDSLVWFYTKDFTKETGSDKWSNTPLPGKTPTGEELDKLNWVFADIIQDDSANWFYSPIKYVYEKGLFVGTGPRTFSPNAPLTRAMLVSVLARMAEVDLSSYSIQAFNDVAIDSWYGQAVAWAKEAGIINGYESSGGGLSFKPDENISRQDIAVMIDNYNKLVAKKTYEQNETRPFSDDMEIAEYAKASISAMQKSGIISGIKNPDGSFRFSPVGIATRAEAATMIYNMLSR